MTFPRGRGYAERAAAVLSCEADATSPKWQMANGRCFVFCRAPHIHTPSSPPPASHSIDRPTVLIGLVSAAHARCHRSRDGRSDFVLNTRIWC